MSGSTISGINPEMEPGMHNIGGKDKFLRIFIGSVLLVIALDGEHFFGQQILWAWIGLVPFLTGIASFCPTYTILGFSTCHTDKNI